MRNYTVSILNYVILIHYSVFGFPSWSRSGNGNNNAFNSAYKGTKIITTNWVIQEPQLFSSQSSAVADSLGNIYYGNCNGDVVLVNSNGNKVWEYNLELEFKGQPLLSDDESILFITGSYGSIFTLFALRVSQYNVIFAWKATLNSKSTSSPAMSSDQTQIIVTTTHLVYGIDVITGNIVWMFDTAQASDIASPLTSPSIDADGTIYFGSTTGILYALSSDGIIKWTFSTAPLAITHSISIGNDGTVYFGSMNQNLYGLFPNGTLKWSQSITLTLTHSFDYVGTDIALYNNNLIFGTFAGSVICLNTNGSLVWDYRDDYKQSFTTSLAVDSVGRTYIASSKTNTVFIFNIKGNLLLNYTNPAVTTYSSNPIITSTGAIVIGNGVDTTLSFGTHPAQLPVSQPTYRPLLTPTLSPVHMATYTIDMYCSQIINGISLSTYLSDPIYPEGLMNAISSVIVAVNPANIQILSVTSTSLTIYSLKYTSQAAIQVKYQIKKDVSIQSFQAIANQLTQSVKNKEFDTALYEEGLLLGSNSYTNCQSDTVIITDNKVNSDNSNPSYINSPAFIALMLVVGFLLPMTVGVVLYRNYREERNPYKLASQFDSDSVYVDLRNDPSIPANYQLMDF